MRLLKKDNSLAENVLQIIRHRATERPGTDKDTLHPAGTYLCRGCGAALFRATQRFQSACGWPSFDDAIDSAVIEKKDLDGKRTEIVCAHCGGHLGHVFVGEQFTQKNKRHCVNSLSMEFIPGAEPLYTEECIVAAGCFWGVQYYLDRLPGVLKTEVGYTGGTRDSPSYRDVCTGETGHLEAVRILYDPLKVDYETIAKYFFEIHDPVQRDGQGPDRGSQYLSAIFYYDDLQKKIAENVIQLLKNKGVEVATHIRPVTTFWPAEEDHQQYYDKTNHLPYCHTYTKRF